MGCSLDLIVQGLVLFWCWVSYGSLTFVNFGPGFWELFSQFARGGRLWWRFSCGNVLFTFCFWVMLWWCFRGFIDFRFL